MARAASRDEIAQLVSEHHASVYRYAFRLCGSEADAEDFAQEAFLFAHERLGQLRDASKARPWLLAIVRNCFRKKLRRRSPVKDVDFELDNLAADAPDSPFDFERLQAAIDALPDEFRLVLDSVSLEAQAAGHDRHHTQSRYARSGGATGRGAVERSTQAAPGRCLRFPLYRVQHRQPDHRTQ